ncbi:hypothetical protein NUW54_g4190 [Trametes sanguinea]|uniref:Uncharacterized protein n=1 Tax=Trametes sanguinea TaxID=158606 RepID=A0ACC1PZW2_9APHY|nr:hypothetical protein NUW54_g4190 [Trametes sanguinea]
MLVAVDARHRRRADMRHVGRSAVNAPGESFRCPALAGNGPARAGIQRPLRALASANAARAQDSVAFALRDFLSSVLLPPSSCPPPALLYKT